MLREAAQDLGRAPFEEEDILLGEVAGLGIAEGVEGVLRGQGFFDARMDERQGGAPGREVGVGGGRGSLPKSERGSIEGRAVSSARSPHGVSCRSLPRAVGTSHVL